MSYAIIPRAKPPQQMEVLLRQWIEEDIEPLAALANNPAIAQNLRAHFPSPYTVADAGLWVRELHKNELLSQAVECDGRLAGSVSLMQSRMGSSKETEIGYWLTAILSPAQPHAILHALRMTHHFVFAVLGARRRHSRA